jgi:hypothetical protein
MLDIKIQGELSTTPQIKTIAFEKDAKKTKPPEKNSGGFAKGLY